MVCQAARGAGSLIIDIHSDVAIDVFARRGSGERRVLASRHLPKWRAGSVGGAVCASGGDAKVLCPYGLDHAYEGALALLEAMEEDIVESEGAIEIARTAADVRRLSSDGVFAVILGLEGAMPVGSNLDRVREFHERGVRVLGLTWNSRNHLATGLGCGAGGLTAAGAQAVALMNDLGIVVDLSHAAARTFFDVLEVTAAPVAVSHANARKLRDHPRNLDDDQLVRLRENGGVCGAVLYGDFVAAGTVTPEDVVDHISYLSDALGEDRVAIGADFVDYFGPQHMADIVRDGDAPQFPLGIEDTASLHVLLEGLAARGYPSDAIEGIAAENFLKLLASVEAHAVTSPGS